tara:strand:+ start:686 stop:1264 length:579 start_codon:yes stop_codon:yes gene_type:complete
MKKILIGTNNPGKFREIGILLSKNIKKISPKKLGLGTPKETGKTFSANAKLKAKYFSKFTQFQVISDDSGLCIKSLNGSPGIFSARWAKKYGSFHKAMKVILKKMKNKKDRSATFVCSLSVVTEKKKFFSVTGRLKGVISKRIVGKNGFGYDPIFIPNSQKSTFGQMAFKKKIKIDHRYIAFQKLKKKIKTL